ncbi:hypothetical protein LUZ60_009268 [Juncus effusus]|nr:hypothetical protein LUZ60_009268 [Juncus effusus]
MPREKSSSCTCTCVPFKPCKGALTLISKPITSIRSFKFQNLREAVEKRSPRRREYKSVRAVFWPLVSMREEGEVDRVGELPSLSLTERAREPFPSPVTPAFIKMVRLRRQASEEMDVQDPDADAACKSFEGYLLEMLVEDKKMRDLSDVEELIYCWDSLKSPVFVDLVCRFYGELCKDLFSDPSDVESSVAGEKNTDNVVIE